MSTLFCGGPFARDAKRDAIVGWLNGWARTERVGLEIRERDREVLVARHDTCVTRVQIVRGAPSQAVHVEPDDRVAALDADGITWAARVSLHAFEPDRHAGFSDAHRLAGHEDDLTVQRARGACRAATRQKSAGTGANENA